MSLHVRLTGEDLEIDLSDQALSDLLLQNLLPRYQAIVRGEEWLVDYRGGVDQIIEGSVG